MNIIRTERIDYVIIANYIYATDIANEINITLSAKYTVDTRLMTFATNEGSKYYPVNQLITGSIKNMKVYLDGNSEERKVLEIIKNNNLPVTVIIKLKDGSSYEGSNMYITSSLIFENNSYSLDFEGLVSRIDNNDSNNQLTNGKSSSSIVAT